LEPLLSIASVIDMQADDSTLPTVKALLGLSKDMGKGREAHEDLNSAIPTAVTAMRSLIDGVEEKFVSADELFEGLAIRMTLGLSGRKGDGLFPVEIGDSPDTTSTYGGEDSQGLYPSQKHLDDLGVRYA